jgi:cytochrome c peroxidase
MKSKLVFICITALVIFSGPAFAGTQFTPIQNCGSSLYRDLNLSLNQNQACITCHHPSAGFEDPANRLDPVNFPVSNGSDPAFFGGRNAPSAAYSGFSPVLYFDAVAGLYIGGMFWDGRATGWTLGDPIAEQALGPFLNPVEMGLTSKAEAVGIVQASSYANLFIKVFGPNAFANVDTAYNNIGIAIAAFERSTKVTKFSSKFDRFWKEQGGDISTFGVDGLGNYVGPPNGFSSRYFTFKQANGLALFNAVNKGNCAACHLTTNYNVGVPPLLTDFTYDNLGVPVNPQIAVLAGPQPIDYGIGARINELLSLTPGISIIDVPSGLGGTVPVAETEAGKFKVPTLRNVERSAPYAHNGYFATLKDITNFYNTRDVALWPAAEVSLNVNSTELGNLGLTPAEESAIVAFMKTLTD